MSKPSTSDDFSVYQHFNRREDLEDVVDTLKHNGIPVRISDDGQGMGEWTEKAIMGTPLRPKFWIEIPANLFEKANFMLLEAAEADLEEADLDTHPFNDYSVADLQEVLVEESDWSPDAVVVARKLLLRRGGDVDLKRLRDASRLRLAEEYAPQRANPLYLVGMAVVALIAGLILWIVGIMMTIGVVFYYAVGTRTDPKGTKHNAYDALTRKRSVAVLGILALSVTLGFVNYLFLKWIAVPDIDGWLWWWR